MNLIHYLGAGLLFVALRNAASRRRARTAMQEAVPVNGTDWQGDLWARLNGRDLVNADPAHRNLDSSLIADPGKVGQAAIGLQPTWNGNL